MSSSNASEIVELADEIRIPVPDNWQVNDDNGTYPFQVINEELSAELLIFKSIIDEESKITNKEELKKSVDRIIKDIVETLPDGQHYTNTGNFEENRVSFTIEFISTDTLTNAAVFHRLKGILYNHPDGHQILFTLWGKATKEAKEILREKVLFLQNNFSYFGVSDEMVLTESEEIDWQIFLLVALIFIAIIFFFRKIPRTSKIPFSKDSHFWRCECGRQNHNNHDTCHRCGRERNNEIKV